MGVSRSSSLLAVLGVLVAACGGGATTTTTTEPRQPTTTTVPPVTAIGSLQDARNGVVQIVAEGTFQDPVVGEQANVPGSGSGFIIDAEGHAITNNHVVTGGALFKVFVPGREKPLNARVVGVSECSDLAVIDIEGAGFPYLAWYEGDVFAGLPIFAAGYPLGDPEYTLLEGVVSKERAGGETSWASNDSVIEHSADTLPGNSGGPILSEEGQVVAVNYAGNDLGQAFAIGRDEARPVVEELLAGVNLDGIGINGEAFTEGYLADDVFSGVWVYSVASGSQADLVGVMAGDVVIRLENLDLAGDGTMADYCDILRSHQAGDVLAIEVYRAATGEVLEGRINGALLEPTFSFENSLGSVIDPEALPGGATGYSEYTTITNDEETIFVDVPVEWSDISGVPWDYRGDGTLIGPALSASPDLVGFIEAWGTPGLFVGASRELTETLAQLLDAAFFGDSCTYVDRVDYDDGFYVGLMDLWEMCGAEGTDFLVIAAEDPDKTYKVVVEILVVSEADWDAADQIIRSFSVVDPSAG